MIMIMIMILILSVGRMRDGDQCRLLPGKDFGRLAYFAADYTEGPCS